MLFAALESHATEHARHSVHLAAALLLLARLVTLGLQLRRLLIGRKKMCQVMCLSRVYSAHISVAPDVLVQRVVEHTRRRTLGRKPPVTK